MAQSLTHDLSSLRARLAADASLAKKPKLILDAAGAARLGALKLLKATSTPSGAAIDRCTT
jgi:hypothetical protein